MLDSRSLGLVLTLTISSLSGRAIPRATIDAEDALDPEAPCTAERLSPVTYDVDFRAVVTAPHHTKLLRVWMPVPPTDSTQTVEGSAFETWPMRVEPRIETEPLYGNRFAYFEFVEPKGAQSIRHSFRVTTHELRWHIRPELVETVAEWPASFDPYLRDEEQAVVLSEAVRGRAAQIVPQPGNAASDLRGILRWIEGTMRYDHSNASLRASSEWALERSTGHCSDYHGLCAALGRAVGHPTRVVYGLNPFPKDSPSHCKVEVFLPPHGWVSFDLSETQKLLRSIEKRADLAPEAMAELREAALGRLVSGFRDNTWFAQTRGTDYELAPPASRRVPVVRTLYAEADGRPLPEPDPGDATKREFAWMTMHAYVPDKSVPYPFSDLKALEPWMKSERGER